MQDEQNMRGNSWRSKDEIISEVSNELLHMNMPILIDQQGHTYISSVQTLDAV